MIILLDHDGGVLGTLDIDATPDSVMVNELGVFEFEATTDDDHIYRQVES